MFLSFVASGGESSTGFTLLNIPSWHWGVFLVFVAGLLFADLRLHRKDHEPSTKSIVIQCVVWVSIGILTGFGIWGIYGADAGAEYFSGFIIEKSLSVDNVFVWALILTFFRIPSKYQHRVLFWGVFGAMVMRAAFILGGLALLEAVHWLLLVLAAFLLFTAWKVGFSDSEFDPEKSRIIRFVQRFIPFTPEFHGHKLFIREATGAKGKMVRKATPLFIALLAVELVDVLFAVDSVPAILAVAHDPFIVFASNVMAILGLRALYFLFDKLKSEFRYLDKGLGFVLTFVAIKMTLGWAGIHFNTWYSLIIIACILAAAIYASIRAGTVEEVEEAIDEKEHQLVNK